MNKNILAGIAIALSLILGVLAVSKPAQVVKETNTVQAGSVTSLDQPCLTFGGVTHCYAHSTLSQASTTICQLTSPNATSTLVAANVTLSTGTTTALVLDIGKSTTPTATTTLFNSVTVASNALGTVVASTTGSGVLANTLDPISVFAAQKATSTDAVGNLISGYYGQTYLVFKIGGAQGALNTLAGSCNAEWIVD